MGEGGGRRARPGGGRSSSAERLREVEEVSARRSRSIDRIAVKERAPRGANGARRWQSHVSSRAPALRHAAKAKAPAQTQVIALANQKGGVAKTTTTLNLGVAFAEQGLRVLCIDLDPQGNLTMSQGMNPDTIERSMFDVLVHRAADHRGDRARARSTSPSPRSTSPAPTWRSRARSGASARCRRRSSRSRTSYDYILIDTPPSLGLLTINAFVAATGVIVPVQTEYLSLRGLVQLENTLQMVRENLNPKVAIIGILPTMYDRRITHSREADEILRENFGDLVYNTRIRKTIRYAEAPVKGSSIIAYEPDGEAAALYRDLAKEVLNGEKAR